MRDTDFDFEEMEVVAIAVVENCYDCDDGNGGECDSCDCDS